ncbi:hypothetical protein BaRGS_00010162 [Batillaria attramentaria]|uniref:Plethodontid modulating factor n=1 Tax=Batillaria attramentaria TaxID=370345 RepID=A0ABD0LGM6_9CAEN
MNAALILVVLAMVAHSSAFPCTEGEDACANQPETAFDGHTHYCCPANHAIQMSSGTGGTTCTCTSLGR